MPRTVQLPAPGRGAYDRSMSRAERDAEHRERLLLATAEVSSVSAATVARIVERAGVGRGTFYEFFDSPEHALQLLEQRVLRAVGASLSRNFPDSASRGDRVTLLVRRWLRALSARPLESRLVLTTCARAPLLSPAGELFRGALEREARATPAALEPKEESTLLAAAAAVEVVTRSHLFAAALAEPERVLTGLITRLLFLGG